MMARSLVTATLAREKSIISGETEICDGTVDNFIALRKLTDSHGFGENFPFFHGYNSAGVGWTVEWKVLCAAILRKTHRAEVIREIKECLTDVENEWGRKL